MTPWSLPEKPYPKWPVFRRSDLAGFGGSLTQLPEHPLNLNYQRMLTAGTKPNLAKLTLARQIAAIVLSMWKHGEAYDPERQKRVVTDQA